MTRATASSSCGSAAPEGTDQTYCKVDVGIATAQSLLVGPDDEVYVVSARPPTSGVWRYSDLPTSADAAGGCGATDGTGAPLVDSVDPGAGPRRRAERRPVTRTRSRPRPTAASTCPA